MKGILKKIIVCLVSGAILLAPSMAFASEVDELADPTLCVYEDYNQPGIKNFVPISELPMPRAIRSYYESEFDMQGENTGTLKTYHGLYMGVEVYSTLNSGTGTGSVTRVTVLGPGLGSGRELTVMPNGQMHKLDNIPIQDGAEYYLRYFNSGGNVHLRVKTYSWDFEN